MKLIEYTIINKKFYRDMELITENQAKSELRGQKFRELLKTNKCRIRGDSLKLNKNEIRKSKDEKLLEESINDYRIQIGKYRTGTKIELWRKNNKYGYFNFVTYLDNDSREYVNPIILNDIKNQKIEQKKKKKKLEIQDEDI